MPGKSVVLLLEQDAAMVAGVLGILKAGKIFVAVDPTFPQSRNSYILEDPQTALIVTNNRNLGLANELAQARCQILNLDELDSGLPAENPSLAIPPDHLAFILYTSGSTGQPKGVVLSHRALIHDIMRRSNLFGICLEDRLSLLTSGTSEAIRNICIALFRRIALLAWVSDRAPAPGGLRMPVMSPSLNDKPPDLPWPRRAASIECAAGARPKPSPSATTHCATRVSPSQKSPGP